jgi:hypothetical protein
MVAESYFRRPLARGRARETTERRLARARDEFAPLVTPRDKCSGLVDARCYFVLHY